MILKKPIRVDKILHIVLLKNKIQNTTLFSETFCSLLWEYFVQKLKKKKKKKKKKRIKYIYED
jgi:hypothetical protein